MLFIFPFHCVYDVSHLRGHRVNQVVSVFVCCFFMNMRDRL
jgi:hypothetical protein